MAELVSTSDSQPAWQALQGTRSAERTYRSENLPCVSGLSLWSEGSAGAEAESVLRDWEGGMCLRHPAVPAVLSDALSPTSLEPSPPTPPTSSQSCCAGPHGGERATRRIRQLVNLSSRTLRAAAWAPSTWSACAAHAQG